MPSSFLIFEPRLWFAAPAKRGSDAENLVQKRGKAGAIVTGRTVRNPHIAQNQTSAKGRRGLLQLGRILHDRGIGEDSVDPKGGGMPGAICLPGEEVRPCLAVAFGPR